MDSEDELNQNDFDETDEEGYYQRDLEESLYNHNKTGALMGSHRLLRQTLVQSSYGEIVHDL